MVAHGPQSSVNIESTISKYCKYGNVRYEKEMVAIDARLKYKLMIVVQFN